ncbi:MAG: type II toxin-antitoxin system PemK/MazF family toxin [Candidatus Sericytochromatia bacterium]|nr:type II toxin-antitoxin system PemK/MazF family toxin [Candidatus Sericytochromatia bacterium]
MVRMPTHDPAGHEQQGIRPAVVVGIPVPPVRYPMVMVVPLTSKTGGWQTANPTLYPVLQAGSG